MWPTSASDWCSVSPHRAEHRRDQDGAHVEAIVLFHVAGPPVTVLGEDECWSLLSSLSLGRFVTCLDGRPEIFPVNFVTQRPTVLLRTAEGTKLFGAATPPSWLSRPTTTTPHSPTGGASSSRAGRMCCRPAPKSAKLSGRTQNPPRSGH